MQMTLEEFLTYAKQLEGKRYSSLKDVKGDIKKIESLMKRFGFSYYRSFSTYCGDFSNKKPDTTFFYRKQAGESEHGYIQIQLGYIVRGKRGSQFIGVFRTEDNSKPDLHPSGRPWRIGDVKEVNQYYSLVLTRRGWWSGD